MTITNTYETKYTLTYMVGSIIYSQTTNIPKGTEKIIIDCLATPPEGKVFDGWRDDNGNIYVPGDKIIINSNTTLYAIWKDKEEDIQLLNDFWMSRVKQWSNARAQFDASMVNGDEKVQYFYIKGETTTISLQANSNIKAVKEKDTNVSAIAANGVDVTLYKGNQYIFTIKDGGRIFDILVTVI